MYDFVSTIEIETLFLKATDQMISKSGNQQLRLPAWTKKINEILYNSDPEKITLDYLSTELNIHPVHISRDFSKHFNCSLGCYLRKIKVEKALSLLSNKDLSLTSIAFDCGFADQSHFLRCFKNITGFKPSEYRKIILR